jgi:prepilin signal peptidase PulO-like enzyme (type II secretory pathway)
MVLPVIAGLALAAVPAVLIAAPRLAGAHDASLDLRAGSIALDWLAGLALYVVTGATSGDWIAAACAGTALMAGLNAVHTDISLGTISDYSSLVILGTGALYASRAISDLTLLESGAGGAFAGAILLLALVIVRIRSGLAGLGSGDIVLGIAAGFWTGYAGVGPALLAAVAITGLLAFIRRAGRTTRLPFAPGLVAGFALTAVLQELS